MKATIVKIVSSASESIDLEIEGAESHQEAEDFCKEINGFEDVIVINCEESKYQGGTYDVRVRGQVITTNFFEGQVFEE